MLTKERISYSLRIRSNNRVNLEKIRDELQPDFNLELIDISDGDFKSMLRISDLNKDHSGEKLISVISPYGFTNKEINLFISYTTERDISGFSFSQKMVEIIARTQCSVDFSLIFIED